MSVTPRYLNTSNSADVYKRQAVILLFAGVLVVTEMGYNVNSLIAGLGLGGLTFALAAQDSASNFFGGLVIIFEKPFELGDWIRCV